MAATAYASLVSLLNTMDQICTHPLVSTFFYIKQNNYLCEKVNLFVDFVEKYSDAESREVEDMVRRIGDAAREAENILEEHAADRIRGGETPSFIRDLQLVLENMESIKNEVIDVKEEFGKNLKEEVIKVREETGKSPSVLPDPPPPSSSAPPATAEATTMVGFDDYKHKLLDDVIGHDVGRQIISITGMGGIGKTTLARNLYENSHVVRHFNFRVWITVSQDSSARKVFLQALSSLGGDFVDMDTANDQQLSVALHKTLFNRRYLIVLDDLWSVEVWDKIKFYFPDNKNGSRIVVTTRELKLIDYIGSSVLAIKFLSKENSWKLFCVKTFAQHDFPPELEEVAKKIVQNCGGLPLAISVIGRLLDKSPRTREHWEKVARDKSSILNSGEHKPLDILYLSYKYLPVCLKPCFIYLGLYPEDSDIDASELIKLWIAEGFIKAIRGQSLEEVGESFINELVDRNLLLRFRGPSRISFSTHDLVRDLCIRIGEKENFFSVQRSIDGNYHFIVDQRTAEFYPDQNPHTSRTPSILHPLIVPQGRGTTQFKTRLLRVLRCYGQRGHYDVLQEVNMRFFHDYRSNVDDYFLPSLVSRFWSLQTILFTACKKVVAPVEIWKMPQLRHIDIRLMVTLPHHPPTHSDDDVYILQNLQTLKTVRNLIFTEEVCKRMPNIKELDMYYKFFLRDRPYPYFHLENVGCFNKLESLKYTCFLAVYADDSLQNIRFPSSLKKLTLSNCNLEWDYMAVIASLPHLQYLYLEENAVPATEWVFVDERFVSLKILHIMFCGHVTVWIAESSNFPVLEELHIKHLPQIDEIPSGIGEIATLQRIDLQYCSESANISAVEILYEQQRFENLELHLTIQTYDDPELLREKIQQLGFTCQNLVIKAVNEWFVGHVGNIYSSKHYIPYPFLGQVGCCNSTCFLKKKESSICYM